MRLLDPEKIDEVKGKRIFPGDRFNFDCHSGVSCFNLCCRNLNLYLYPYDVLRLSKALSISSEEFIEEYTDIVMRKGEFFPEILLRMSEDKEKICPFLGEKGCKVYKDRPDTCRVFPLEHGSIVRADGKFMESVSFFRPPDFCMGHKEARVHTLESWAGEQDALTYNRMTREWSLVRALFTKDPWGGEGFYGNKGKMAFMAVYHLDKFRAFLFDSSFFKRYKVQPNLKGRLKKDDLALLRFAFDWVSFFVWGLKVNSISLRS